MQARNQQKNPLPVEAVTFGAGWSDKAIAHIGFVNKSQYREVVLFSGCHSAEKWHLKSYFFGAVSGHTREGFTAWNFRVIFGAAAALPVIRKTAQKSRFFWKLIRWARVRVHGRKN